jgi:hypothetical protein
MKQNKFSVKWISHHVEDLRGCDHTSRSWRGKTGNNYGVAEHDAGIHLNRSLSKVQKLMMAGIGICDFQSFLSSQLGTQYNSFIPMT